MYKSSIRGVILDQIQFSFSTDPDTDVARIYDEVISILGEVAWFHRLPVLTLATATTIICCIRYGKTLDDLNQAQRQRFVNGVAKLPLWSLFQKLISSIALLHFFDDHTIEERKA